MKTIKDWENISLEYAKSKDFDLTKTTDGDKLMLIVSEAAEALESIRNGEDNLWFNGAKPEGLAAELADIMLRTIQMAAFKNIDLNTVMELKHEYNLTRPPKHGGKKF